MQLAPTASSTPATPGNPWRFPALDSGVAQRAVDGLDAGVAIVNRLIDRAIVVRTMLDRDLKSSSFAADTVRAVELLARAREYAEDTLRDTHLSDNVLEPIHAWIRTSRDERIRVVSDSAHAIQSAVTNLIDDEEGNVADLIASMRTDATRGTWKAMRETVDFSLESLYGSRDTSGAEHVLRAAGNLR